MNASTLISSELANFISGPVMMVTSTRDHRFRATIGRGTGAMYDEATGLIDIFVCRAQWPDVIENAVPGGKIAATSCAPRTISVTRSRA